MGIFDRLRQTQGARQDAAPVATDKTQDTAVVSTPVAPDMKAAATMTGADTQVLVTPWVSEKAAILASKGTYVFQVPIAANKVEIQKAVEKLYKVKVDRVHTVRGIGKIVARGRQIGRRSKWKKALVTLKTGQTIDLYQGV